MRGLSPLSISLDVEERPAESDAVATVYHAAPSYFGTLRIPMLEGEDVTNATTTVEAPVILSAAAARAPSPTGPRSASGCGGPSARAHGGPWLGSGDVPATRVAGEPAEIVYVPMLETPVDPRRTPSQGTLVVRALGAPVALAPDLRRIVRELDPNLPVANVRTMAGVVSTSMARPTFTMLLLVVSGATALLLGVVGVYGVTSYVVGRRTQEIGLRVALGARAPDVERMVLADGLRTILLGAGVGLLAALAVARMLGSLLYGVSTTDVPSFALVVLLLVLTASGATWLPARRAARVDPCEALRLR